MLESLEETIEQLDEMRTELQAISTDNRNLIDGGADFLSAVAAYINAIHNNETPDKIKDLYEPLKDAFNQLKGHVYREPKNETTIPIIEPITKNF